MKKFLAAVLAMAMVFSVAAFQTSTTAGAAEAPDGTVVWTWNTKDNAEVKEIFTVSSTEKLSTKKGVSCTYNGKEYPDGTVLKLDSKTTLTINVPSDDGTLTIVTSDDTAVALYSPTSTVQNLAGTLSTNSGDNGAYVSSAKVTKGIWTIKRDSSEGHIACVIFTPNDTTPTVTAPPSADMIQIDSNINAATIDITVSNYGEGYSFFAVSSDTDVATVSTEAPTTRAADPNGVYKVTITPGKGAKLNAAATIYVGMSTSTITTAEAARGVDGVRQISVTVTKSVTYHLNIPSEVDSTKSGQDYVYSSENNTVLELKEAASGGFKFETDTINSSTGAPFEHIEHGYLGDNINTAYYFVGWSDTDPDNITDPKITSIDYTNITYPVGSISSGKNGDRLLYPDNSHGKYTTDSGELWAVWAPAANSGLFGYTMQLEGATFPGVDTSTLQNNWHINSGTRLGDNGVSTSGNWQKFVVLDEGHQSDSGSDSDILTAELPETLVNGYSFVSWFNKFVNPTGGGTDPNHDYLVFPEGLSDLTGATANQIKYGGSHNIYSLDAVWALLSVPGNRVELYKAGGYTLDLTGQFQVSLVGGSYSNSEYDSTNHYNRSDMTGWNNIFGNGEAEQVTTVTSGKLRYYLTITGPDGTSFAAYETSGYEASNLPNDINFTKPGVYKITVRAMLEGVDVTDGSGTGNNVTFKLDENEFTFTIIPQLTVNVTKDLQGRAWQPGESFAFSVGVTENANVSKNNLTVTGTEPHQDSTVISFEELTGTSSKTYSITISETTSGELGMDYATTRTIDVTLTKNADGTYSLSGAGVTPGTDGNYTLQVTMTNALKTGSLTVQKVVEANGSSKAKDKYTITVTFSNWTPPTSLVSGNITGVSGNTVTLSLGNGEYATIPNIPRGAQYTVAEDAASSANATVTYPGGRTGIINEGDSVNVTVRNTYAAPRGNLTITKNVVGENISVSETFTFTVKPVEGTQMARGVTVTGGTVTQNADRYTVTLNYPASNSVTLNNLPAGKYVVEEASTGLVPGLFKTPVSQTVTVPEDNTAAVTVTNEIQKGSLTVTKDVVEESGATPDAGKKFEFRLSLSVPNGVTSYTVNVNGTPFTVGAGKTVVTFELADGETCKIDGIPYGVSYTLSETLEGPDEHFYASSFGGQSSGTINATTPAPTVTCTNTHHAIAEGTGALHLFKYTQGQTEQTDFTFSVTFTYEGEAEHQALFENFAAAQGVTLAGANTFTKTYTVKKGDNLLITNIPDGTAYSVSEVTAEMTGDKEPTEILAQFDNDSAEATDLVSGSYKTTVVNGKINGDVSEDHDHDDVVFYNRYLIDLTIKKVVEAAGAGSPVLPPDDAEFVFVLEFNGFEESELDQLRNVMYITDAHGVHTYEDLIDDFRDDNKVTLYVTTSTPAVIYKVPAGRSHYNITEIETFDADEVEFSINGTTTQGDTTGFVVVERSTSEIIFTNRYTHSVGKIEITKNLAGTGTLPPEDTEFSFTVQLTGRNGQPLSGSFGGYEFVNGTATVKVKAGQTLTLDQIPYGTTYTITEVESSRGDNVSVSVDGVSAAAGSVSAAGTIDAESITVVFTNEYEDTDPPTDPTDPPTDPTDPPTDPTDPSDDPDEPKPPTPPTLNGEDHFGYIVGYPGEVYVRPNSPITRAELVSILFRLLKDEVREQYRPALNRVYFTDVNRESWYSLAVGTLANMGIISGYGDGTFRPDRYITRAEMAVIVSKFFENSENTYFSDFTDVPQDAWYARYVAFAKSIGLMVGNGDGTFGPDTRLSRAEAMAVFNRLLGRTPTRDSFERVAGEMKTWADNANPNLWYYADVQEATNSHEFVIVDGHEVWTEITEMIDWTKLNESYQYGN